MENHGLLWSALILNPFHFKLHATVHVSEVDLLPDDMAPSILWGGQFPCKRPD